MKFFHCCLLRTCAAFICLASNSASSFAVATEPRAVLKKQFEYRRSFLPLEFEADVTTTTANRPTRMSRYYCKFDENCLIVVRHLNWSGVDETKITPWVDSVESGIIEHISFSKDRLFWHSSTPEMNDKVVVANLLEQPATALFDRRSKAVPAMRSYGMQLFPFTIQAAGSVKNFDVLLSPDPPKCTITTPSKTERLLEYSIGGTQVSRLYATDKGNQLLSYLTRGPDSDTPVQRSQYNLEHIDGKFWFPMSSIYTSTVSGSEYIRVETRVQRVSSHSSWGKNKCGMEAINVPVGLPVKTHSSQGSNTLVYNGATLVDYKNFQLPTVVPAKGNASSRLIFVIVNLIGVLLIAFGLVFRYLWGRSV